MTTHFAQVNKGAGGGSFCFTKITPADFELQKGVIITGPFSMVAHRVISHEFTQPGNHRVVRG
ncbi:hypothetical protein D3C80_1782140 [compost metagenome]